MNEFRERVRRLLVSEDFADDYADEIAGKVLDRLPDELVTGEPGVTVWDPAYDLTAEQEIRRDAVKIAAEMVGQSVLSNADRKVLDWAKSFADFITTG